VLAAIADTDALLRVALASAAAGIGITAVFGIVIYGGTRFMDLRREGNRVGAVFFAVVAVACFAAFAAAVAFGLTIMTRK
jgi:hypothetical protein